MNILVPSAEDIRQELQPLGTAQMRRLAELSGVPFSTLWKVRSGETANPGVETVRKFRPHIASADAARV